MTDRVVRAWADAWIENDPEALIEVVHPEIELYLPRSAIEGTVYRGVEGVERALAEGHATWERFEIVEGPVEVRAEGDWHLNVTRLRQTPRGSGPTVEYDSWWLFRVADERLIYSHPYQDRDEAIAAFERATASE